MKILVLDVYRDVDHRISKDTSGGYGTGNNFGDTLIPNLLKKSLKKIHDWSPMFVAYTISVLKKNGNQVFFEKKLPNNFENYDLYIVASSIVCCETEIDVIKKIKSIEGKVFAIGPFATNQPKIYNEYKDKIITNSYEECDQYNLIYKHKSLNKNIVRKYLDKAYRTYYFRIRWVLKFIRSFIFA